MIIENILCAPGLGGFFNDDQRAIRESAVEDGDDYRGAPLTAGFSSIRMPAQTLGVGLVLEDGYVAWGDGMSVQYAGVGGRDPLFDPALAEDQVKRTIAPFLRGRDVCEFLALASAVDVLRAEDTRLLHAGIRYA